MKNKKKKKAVKKPSKFVGNGNTFEAIPNSSSKVKKP